MRGLEFVLPDKQEWARHMVVEGRVMIAMDLQAIAGPISRGQS